MPPRHVQKPQPTHAVIQIPCPFAGAEILATLRRKVIGTHPRNPGLWRIQMSARVNAPAGPGGGRMTKSRVTSCKEETESRQLVEQRPGVLEDRRVKAFGEPAVDWCEKITGFASLTHVAPEAGEARGTQQLP